MSIVFMTQWVFINTTRASGYIEEFKVYDALIYKDKPNMSLFGLNRLTLLNHIHLLDPGKMNIKNNIASYFRPREIAELIVVNIEHWPLKDNHDLNTNIPKYIRAVKFVKDRYSNKRIGIYSMFPERNYWASQEKTSSSIYKKWSAKNNRLQVVSKYSDVIMPSLYTYYTDQQGWVKYAKNQIAESKRIYPTKPVIVFLWPQYHGSNWLHGGDYINGDYWRLQLETAYKHADGIIIWGGWDDKAKRHLNWVDDLEWWKETKSFIKRIKNEKK
ncbi:MAG: hypothetical protein KUG81_06765 [Gammaproteobacteria bacterium]|nr:hypothetical protein [Gammaproteobacteria bacterium]